MSSNPIFHHIAIQTKDMINCVSWYQEFFGCKKNWSLNKFSNLTLTRLPGIRELVELEIGNIKLHIFDRESVSDNLIPEQAAQFQHFCITVPQKSDLVQYREKWDRLAESGRFHFAKWEAPSDIVIDSDGVASLYLLDVNGLEFELCYIPDESNR